MSKLSPDCPLGVVSFVQETGLVSIDWLVNKYFRTEESSEDYAKFRRSLMDNFSSLALSAIMENEVPFGWCANDELRTLETYYFIASLRSSRHKRDLSSELFELKLIHSYYAYAKSLSTCDFIKLDSDFEEIFQRLKSENRWPEQSDDFLRALLENHFSILHEVNDNSSVMDVSAGNRLELWINKYFVPHMKYKSMVQKHLDQARVLRTEYIPQESHLTTQKRFELKNRALVAKSWILEKLSQMKGRGERQYWGPGTRCVPGLLLVFASLTAVSIGKIQVT
ncbi:hypothetical protein RHMOL_Rhmol10G0022500 [Rhododendron molle]|uniref:Uncharacterized protein n=1 Tax=Rhododendron molle TaxID=49168 RepID=A0ACC0LZJ9_RHOML|nr:hypothetical protein RHMOL_Rhmol10G0022500 [Rhododendron molle]